MFFAQFCGRSWLFLQIGDLSCSSCKPAVEILIFSLPPLKWHNPPIFQSYLWVAAITHFPPLRSWRISPVSSSYQEKVAFWEVDFKLEAFEVLQNIQRLLLKKKTRLISQILLLLSLLHLPSLDLSPLTSILFPPIYGCPLLPLHFFRGEQ